MDANLISHYATKMDVDEQALFKFQSHKKLGNQLQVNANL
jgi:hypothetical protein